MRPARREPPHSPRRLVQTTPRPRTQPRGPTTPCHCTASGPCSRIWARWPTTSPTPSPTPRSEPPHHATHAPSSQGLRTARAESGLYPV